MNELSESELLLGFSTIFACYSGYQWLINRKRRKEKRLHITELDVLNRNSAEYFENIFQAIKNDPTRCFKYTRMSKPAFDKLVCLLNPHLQMKSFCSEINTEILLALTLSYLSQGVTDLFLRWAFKVGRPEARAIVSKTCEIIWEVLSSEYVAPPDIDEIKMIADDFETDWDLPNCVGVLDSKCFPIQRTSTIRGASIVLVASCDTRYLFRLVDTKIVANDNEKGKLPKLLKYIFSGDFPLPPEDYLPNSDIKFPFYFIGDIIFPLKHNLMRPYPERSYSGVGLHHETQNFNNRIARGRSLVENSFGILMARWRVLRSPLNFTPANAQRIILATIALHNFIKSNHDAALLYSPLSLVDNEDSGGNIIPGDWRDQVEQNQINSSSQLNRFGSNNTTRSAMDIRDVLKDYFLKEGAIPIQSK